MKKCKFLASILALALASGMSGCSPDGPAFTIVSGSENKVLEPIVRDFCASKGVKCELKYQGSLDIALSLKPGSDPGVDAVWPAASIWVDVFDTARRVKHVKSIAQMPVILGVRKTKAQQLGWIGKTIKNDDILSAVDTKQLKFLMTSATQSNSGASAYLAMLAAALGNPDTIEAAELDRPDVRNKVKRMLRGVARSAGSSGWLADLYVKGGANGKPFDAMWNYEAVIKETNERLKAAGREQLYGIYPVDGISMADSPLGFFDRNRGPEVENFFKELQQYLLSSPIQKRIAATGRRIKFLDTAKSFGDPANNIDPARPVTVIRPPEPRVIQKALTLYQTGLRRPSLTALCLDYSGSMQGIGEQQLRDALRFLLTPAQAQNFLVQWTVDDQIHLLAFNDNVIWEASASGKPNEQDQLLSAALQLRASGGTDIYTCARGALQRMRQHVLTGEFLPAIVVMTDGMSDGSIDLFSTEWHSIDAQIPVFSVTFGSKVKREQLQELADLTGGRVFDGTKSLTQAFRVARGYN